MEPNEEEKISGTASSTWNLLPIEERQLFALHAIADAIGRLMVSITAIAFIFAAFKLLSLIV